MDFYGISTIFSECECSELLVPSVQTHLAQKWWKTQWRGLKIGATKKTFNKPTQNSFPNQFQNTDRSNYFTSESQSKTSISAKFSVTHICLELPSLVSRFLFPVSLFCGHSTFGRGFITVLHTRNVVKLIKVWTRIQWFYDVYFFCYLESQAWGV